jgi:hypothetical protein
MTKSDKGKINGLHVYVCVNVQLFIKKRDKIKT